MTVSGLRSHLDTVVSLRKVHYCSGSQACCGRIACAPPGPQAQVTQLGRHCNGGPGSSMVGTLHGGRGCSMDESGL